MQIAIRELKSHFSKYLKEVQEGAEIIVTTHGKPIACFCQLNLNSKISNDNKLLKLDWVHPGNGSKPIGLPLGKRIKPKSGKDLSELLLDDRE